MDGEHGQQLGKVRPLGQGIAGEASRPEPRCHLADGQQQLTRRFPVPAGNPEPLEHTLQELQCGGPHLGKATLRIAGRPGRQRQQDGRQHHCVAELLPRRHPSIQFAKDSEVDLDQRFIPVQGSIDLRQQHLQRTCLAQQRERRQRGTGAQDAQDLLQSPGRRGSLDVPAVGAQGLQGRRLDLESEPGGKLDGAKDTNGILA